VIVLSAAATALSAPAAQNDEAPLRDNEAGIVDVKGQVTLVTSSGAKLGVREGQVVPSGAVFQTGNKSHVQIGFGPNLGKSILIEEKSKATVTPRADTKVDIEKGSLCAVLDKVKPGTKFQLETPHGIAGVRGTILRIMIEGTEKSVVAVKHGIVATYTFRMRETGTITSGEKGYVQENLPLFKEQLSADDVKNFDALTRTIDQNTREYMDMRNGNFDARTVVQHEPQKQSYGGGKSVQRELMDGETKSRDGFLQTGSREFIDNRWDRQSPVRDQTPPPTPQVQPESPHSHP